MKSNETVSTESAMQARLERSTSYLQHLRGRVWAIARGRRPEDVQRPPDAQELATMDARVKAAEQDLYRTLNYPRTPLRVLRAEVQRNEVEIAKTQRQLRCGVATATKAA